MNYELAKQLKDAGFPQREPNSPEPHDRYCGYGLGFCFDDGVYVPTLSELIEACGDFDGKFNLGKYKGKWTAIIPNAFTHLDLLEGWRGEGDTPEEAVARLWLALNKKP